MILGNNVELYFNINVFEIFEMQSKKRSEIVFK